MSKVGYVYILSNKNRTVLYIGITSNLENRILRHKAGRGSSFTAKYSITELLHFERIHGMAAAISREKQLKRWHKAWKWNLIKETNPDMVDLAAEWFTKEEVNETREML